MESFITVPQSTMISLVSYSFICPALRCVFNPHKRRSDIYWKFKYRNLNYRKQIGQIVKHLHIINCTFFWYIIWRFNWENVFKIDICNIREIWNRWILICFTITELLSPLHHSCQRLEGSLFSLYCLFFCVLFDYNVLTTLEQPLAALPNLKILLNVALK